MHPRISISGSVRPSVRGSVSHVEKPPRGASNGQYLLLFTRDETSIEAYLVFSVSEMTDHFRSDAEDDGVAKDAGASRCAQRHHV